MRLPVHAAHNLNVHQPDEFLIVIIEPLVRQELLQNAMSWIVSYLSGLGRLISFK